MHTQLIPTNVGHVLININDSTLKVIVGSDKYTENTITYDNVYKINYFGGKQTFTFTRGSNVTLHLPESPRFELSIVLRDSTLNFSDSNKAMLHSLQIEAFGSKITGELWHVEFVLLKVQNTQLEMSLPGSGNVEVFARDGSNVRIINNPPKNAWLNTYGTGCIYFEHPPLERLYNNNSPESVVIGR